jgi:hypothetical protein
MEENKEIKEREYLKIYGIGYGLVSIQSGILRYIDKDTHEEKHRFPFIDLSMLKDKKEIGEDLGFIPESNDFVKLFFANIDWRTPLRAQRLCCLACFARHGRGEPSRKLW